MDSDLKQKQILVQQRDWVTTTLCLAIIEMHSDGGKWPYKCLPNFPVRMTATSCVWMVQV